MRAIVNNPHIKEKYNTTVILEDPWILQFDNFAKREHWGGFVLDQALSSHATFPPTTYMLVLFNYEATRQLHALPPLLYCIAFASAWPTHPHPSHNTTQTTHC